MDGKANGLPCEITARAKAVGAVGEVFAPLSWSLDGLSKLLLEVKIEGPLEKPVTTYNREKFTGWLEKIRVRK